MAEKTMTDTPFTITILRGQITSGFLICRYNSWQQYNHMWRLWVRATPPVLVTVESWDVTFMTDRLSIQFQNEFCRAMRTGVVYLMFNRWMMVKQIQNQNKKYFPFIVYLVTSFVSIRLFMTDAVTSRKVYFELGLFIYGEGDLFAGYGI